MQAGHDRNIHFGLKAMIPAFNITGSLLVKFVPNSRKAFSYIYVSRIPEFACMTVGLLKFGEQQGAQKANEHFAQRPWKVYRMPGQDLCWGANN
jgi:hypothetical protein